MSNIYNLIIGTIALYILNMFCMAIDFLMSYKKFTKKHIELVVDDIKSNIRLLVALEPMAGITAFVLSRNIRITILALLTALFFSIWLLCSEIHTDIWLFIDLEDDISNGKVAESDKEKKLDLD